MLKSKNKRKSRGVINLLGQTFGYLTVIEYVGLNKHNKSTWLCLCMCGNKIETSGNDLRRGHTKSCSCLQKEKASNRITHGLSRNRYLTGYSCWANIKSRCRNKKSISYKNYGAIGVKMCDRWYYSFDNFINDMGERPSMIHSVDRYPNKKGNYEPGNCRWATPDEQARNTKSNVWLECNGIKMVQSDWAKRWGVTSSLIKQHMNKYGRPFEYVYNYYENNKPPTNE